MRKTGNYFSIFVKITISLLITFSLLLGLVTKAKAKREFVRFGGSNPGGIWYVVVGGKCSLYNKQVKGVNFSLVSTAGTTGNNMLARKGEIDTWYTHSYTAVNNYNGRGNFKGKGPYKNIRMFTGMYEGQFAFVVLDKTKDIQTLSDIVGRKVCMGGPGSGSQSNAEAVLTALDMYDKIKVQLFSYGACGRGLTDGHVEVFACAMQPLPAIVTAGALNDLRFIELTEEQRDKVVKYHGGIYHKSTIPAETYKSIKKPSPCIGYYVYWAGQKSMNPDTVYQMLKLTFDPEHRKWLNTLHPIVKKISPRLELMKSLGIPLHPGAVRYYKEQGISIPPELIPPEM